MRWCDTGGQQIPVVTKSVREYLLLHTPWSCSALILVTRHYLDGSLVECETRHCHGCCREDGVGRFCACPSSWSTRQCTTMSRSHTSQGLSVFLDANRRAHPADGNLDGSCLRSWSTFFFFLVERPNLIRNVIEKNENVVFPYDSSCFLCSFFIVYKCRIFLVQPFPDIMHTQGKYVIISSSNCLCWEQYANFACPYTKWRIQCSFNKIIWWLSKKIPLAFKNFQCFQWSLSENCLSGHFHG